MHVVEESLKNVRWRLTRAEEALKESEKNAVANRYSAAIIHELNNGMEVLTNLAYLLRINLENTESAREYLAMIEKQLEAMGTTTRRALSFVRPQTEMQTHDLVDIAQTALRLYSGKISRHRLTVYTRLQGPVPSRVMSTEILQVIANLLLNAIDAVPVESGVIWVRVRSSRRLATITIADNGSGMSPAIAKRIFEPYNTSKAHGTGVGLWLSKQIIAKHHGTLQFRTTEHEGRSGTSFRISLPLAS